ncbi:unnamed protein product, partial [Rotaria sp. Silwood1]
SLFAPLAQTSAIGANGLCINGCRAKRSTPTSINITERTTDEQIVISAMVATVCDTFINQATNIISRPSTLGFINAVRQTCITHVTVTGDTEFAKEGIENLITNILAQDRSMDVEHISQLVTNITTITLQASHDADILVEKLVTSATWPCQPHVPVCIIPSLVQYQMIAETGK